MNLQEAMNPTIDDAIKYYKNMIFPQDMSAHTLRAVAMNKLVIKALQEKAARAAPENKALTCDGCEHKGKYEDEYEYGYPSPCTGCKRRSVDYYARKPEK